MTHNLLSQHNHVSYTGVKTYSSTYSYLLLHILGKKILMKMVTSSLVPGALMFYGSAWRARDSFHDMCVVKRLPEAISISGAHGESWADVLFSNCSPGVNVILVRNGKYLYRERTMSPQALMDYRRFKP